MDNYAYPIYLNITLIPKEKYGGKNVKEVVQKYKGVSLFK